MTTIDSSKSSSNVNVQPKSIETKAVVASKGRVAKTAKKINYWAFFGLMFVTIGLIATTIATCGLNQIIFHATVATLDTILGSGAIGLTMGAILITKALIDKNKKINKIININIPKRYGVIGIANKDTTTCWLNSLMQMLLNIPDLKKTLKLNSHFKLFIDNYERAVKEDIKIDTIALREFLKTICPDIRGESHAFHDSYEVLTPILNLCRNLNPNLQNTLVERMHFLRQDGTESITERRPDNNGSISLPQPRESTRRDTLYKRLNEYFVSEQNNPDVDDPKTITKLGPDKSLLGRFLKRKINISEDVLMGKKKYFLEKKKFQFAPKDLFLNIQRFEYKSTTKYINNTVIVPFKLELDKMYIEGDQSASYELSNFIRYVNEAHYISYVKKGEYWFICNDDYVKKISLNDAIKAAKKAYIVHYKKLG